MEAIPENYDFSDDAVDVASEPIHSNGSTQTSKPVYSALKRLLESIPTKVDFIPLVFPEHLKEVQERDKLTQIVLSKKGTPEQSERMQMLTARIEKRKITDKHLIVIGIEIVLETAKKNGWDLCFYQGFYYVYSGSHWLRVDEPDLKTFLGKALEKMGVNKITSRYYVFRDNLFKQFETASVLPAPEFDASTVLINLANGTFEVKSDSQKLRQPSPADFLTYQLQFDYTPKATAPLFTKYLNEVLPDAESQRVLAQFVGYIFTRGLKLEKVLFLYGNGRNGKSVFFDIIRNLVGDHNITYYSLTNLTDDSGYYRAKLSGKLINWASDIGDKLKSETFKLLASGEPVEARLPYKDPFLLDSVCKFAFNTNALPTDVEHTKAYFERFLIIPFDQYIPEDKRDADLSKKIISKELPGVFNWVLSGLNDLLKQGKFSPCEASNKVLAQYQLESDSVALFVDDNDYKPHPNDNISSQLIYNQYREYCYSEGLRPVARKNFNRRMNALGFYDQKRSTGKVFFMKRITE